MLPQEFDVDFYRQTYSDLAHMSSAAAADHFGTFGVAEGREGSPLTRRRGFLTHIREHEPGDVLEIGPFFSPALDGTNIRYFDVFSADELRSRAAALHVDPSNVPDTIHFTNDLRQIDKRFDAIFSSHAIEHQPDLIDHLRAVSSLLKECGSYYLIIPDKRFNFDHFLPESTLGAVLQANLEQRTTHTLESLVEHTTLRAHNDAWRHWHGDHGAIEWSDVPQYAQQAIDEFSQADGAYLDCHAWKFTPKSFGTIIRQLNELGLIDLSAVRVFTTPLEEFEFCAILQKDISTDVNGIGLGPFD